MVTNDRDKNLLEIFRKTVKSDPKKRLYNIPHHLHGQLHASRLLILIRFYANLVVDGHLLNIKVCHKVIFYPSCSHELTLIFFFNSLGLKLDYYKTVWFKRLREGAIDIRHISNGASSTSDDGSDDEDHSAFCVLKFGEHLDNNPILQSAQQLGAKVQFPGCLT